MIEIEGLHKAYGDKVVLAIEQWSLSASNCVLAGENGAGKTTLLLILAGSWLSTDGRLPPGLAAIWTGFRRPGRRRARMLSPKRHSSAAKV